MDNAQGVGIDPTSRVYRSEMDVERHIGSNLAGFPIPLRRTFFIIVEPFASTRRFFKLDLGFPNAIGYVGTFPRSSAGKMSSLMVIVACYRVLPTSCRVLPHAPARLTSSSTISCIPYRLIWHYRYHHLRPQPASTLGRITWCWKMLFLGFPNAIGHVGAFLLPDFVRRINELPSDSSMLWSPTSCRVLPHQQDGSCW